MTPTHPNTPRLLLLAALLFGIVTMHTLGHPGEHATGRDHGGRTAATAHHAPAAQMAATDLDGATSSDAGAHAAASSGAGAHAGDASGAVATAADDLLPRGAAAPDSEGHSTTGMDPMSVCLAVLGALGLALLAARSARRSLAEHRTPRRPGGARR
ncbi:hypothetical protein DY218_17195, partial [Streptomyces triticagri]